MFNELGLYQSRVMSRTKLMKIGPTRKHITSRRGGRKIKKNVSVKLRKKGARCITAELLNPAKMPHIHKEEFKTYNNGKLASPDLYYELAIYHAQLVQSGQCVTTEILRNKGKEICGRYGVDEKKIAYVWLFPFLKCCSYLRNAKQCNGINRYLKTGQACVPNAPQLEKQLPSVNHQVPKTPTKHQPPTHHQSPNRYVKENSKEERRSPVNEENSLLNLFASSPPKTKSMEVKGTTGLNFFLASASESSGPEMINIQRNIPTKKLEKKKINNCNSGSLVCQMYLDLTVKKKLSRFDKRNLMNKVPANLKKMRDLQYWDPVFEFPQLLPLDIKKVCVKRPPVVPPSTVNEEVYLDLFDTIQSFPL